MRNLLLVIFLCGVGALAAATWLISAQYDSPATAGTGDSAFDTSLSSDARIAALERAVHDERRARAVLQEELYYLTAELEALRDGALIDAAPPGAETADSDGAIGAAPTESRESRRERSARRNSPEGRIERLIEAGFAPGEATWIVQREQELQMEALAERFEAGRSGDPTDFYRSRVSASEMLRDELGDTSYEQYLAANGRPTAVTVSSVIGSSPAQTAGLQPGDNIVRYDGQRVFSMTDLNMAALEGDAGANIVVDIERDGVPMQIVIPRGPIGITGGRRR